MDQKQALENIRQIALEYALSSDDKVNRTMEVVKRGDKIIRNEAYVDHKDRILTYVSGKVVLIPPDEIIEIGYN